MFSFVLVLWILGVRGDTTSTSTSITELKNLTTPISTDVINDQQTTTTSSTPLVKIIDPLTGLSHDVSSGNIVITENNTFNIPNFFYDGTLPQTHFIVGKGKEIVENGSTNVPFDKSGKQLPAFNGRNIILRLPEGLKIDDVDWLSVWSYAEHQDLGHVFLKKESSGTPPPQTYGLKDVDVSSGPIVLINKKTLFIPNLHYSNSRQKVYFWVGNGSRPDPKGVAIPDENGSLETLHIYNGQNIYLNLPGDISTDNIEYFGIWSANDEENLGSVPIKGITGVPDVKPKVKILKSAPNTSLTLRLPKCCAPNYILTYNGCQEKIAVEFRPPFKVYEHNETHFRNESLDLDTINFEAFVLAPECEAGKYALNESLEEFAILQNGSLLVKGHATNGILSSGQFCLDNVEWEDGILNMKILVCTPVQKIQQAMFITYITFTIISTFCFAITFLVYFFWLKIEDVHRKCFTGYVFSMCMTFLSLTIVQTAKIESDGCEVLGFFFQIFMISSFTMLAILCCDIFIIVKHIDENKMRQKRLRWYLGIGLTVPILSMIISLSRNLTPDVPDSFFKPQYKMNNCYFDAESQRKVYFYVPICIAMAVSMVSLILTKLTIVKNDQDRRNDYFWINSGTTYKFMFRQCFLTLVIMTISWISNVLMSFLDESNGILNAAIIFEALQGVLIVAVFTANHYGTSYAERRRQKQQPPNLEMTEPLNQNRNGGENVS